MCGSRTASAIVVSSTIMCRLAVNKRVRGEGRAPRGLRVPQKKFNDSDQAPPTPSGVLLSGRGEPAAATAARRHHHLHNQASNVDSRLQQLQRAGAVSANQGRPTPQTHKPTSATRAFVPLTIQENGNLKHETSSVPTHQTCKPTSATRYAPP